jgi:hypothetical protein
MRAEMLMLHLAGAFARDLASYESLGSKFLSRQKWYSLKFGLRGFIDLPSSAIGGCSSQAVRISLELVFTPETELIVEGSGSGER